MMEASHVREYFYVGGEYTDSAAGHLSHSQMYVEKLSTNEGSHQPYPIIFVHSGGQSGTNFLNKPDGGKGWASWFLDHGYQVYIVDRTATARSAWQPTDAFNETVFSADFIAQRFTNVQKYPKWPQAKLHTQWPGISSNQADRLSHLTDPRLLNRLSISNGTEQERIMKLAGEALLDRIGPAVLVTHSQGGLYGWSWADSRPAFVKALIQIEPKGPPFKEAIFSDEFSRPWGLTSIPLTYEPAPEDVKKPLRWQVMPSDREGLLECVLQAEPARKLPNLAKVPILIDTGEASYHAQYDHCFIKFLKQAGVEAEHLELGKVGLHGNGHLQFMERNSDEIAETLSKWIVKTIEGRP